MKTDTYYIMIPGDLGTAEQICDQAITEARENARIYAIPCNWEAEIVEGTVGESFQVKVRVKRYRN